MGKTIKRETVDWKTSKVISELRGKHKRGKPKRRKSVKGKNQ